jgi:hypothetical protein
LSGISQRDQTFEIKAPGISAVGCIGFFQNLAAASINPGEPSKGVTPQRLLQQPFAVALWMFADDLTA